jgi:imidazolonepropionase-like amidohydrolase
VIGVLCATLGATFAGAPPDACVAVTGGSVVGPNGEAAIADVISVGGVIREVRAGAVVPTGCTRIDAGGQVVTAGFVDPFTALGLIEIGLEPSTNDQDLRAPFQDSEKQIRAAVRTSLGYQPLSAVIPVARTGGVTSAIVKPSGGVVSGTGFWVDLAGARQADAIVRDPVAMFAQLGGASRTTGMFVLDTALREAVAWPKAKAAWQRAAHAPFGTSHLDLDALQPVVTGKIPLVVEVNRAADIEGLLAMTRDLPIRLVIVGGAEAWCVKELLAARRVPVVLDGLRFGPSDFDSLRARPDAAKLLIEAGVPVMFSTFDGHMARKLRQVAGNAVREGMPRAAALNAVTRVPAEAFGLADRGQIAAGFVANLVVWSGDPFELSTRVTRMLIQGREVALTSRQSVLRERYRVIGR